MALSRLSNCYRVLSYGSRSSRFGPGFAGVSQTQSHTAAAVADRSENAWTWTDLEQRRTFTLSSKPCCQARPMEPTKAHVHGVDIHYEKVGNGNHTVLLLPGALGCSRTDFVYQLEGLNSSKYTLISFDPRGYGKSRPPDRDWPLNFLERDAHDAAGLMKELGLPRYSVLGWSDGGITGLILAGAYPGNVKKLLTWGANAYVTEQDMKLFRSFENVDNWSPAMRKSYENEYGLEYLRNQWKNWVDAYGRYYSQRNGDICIGSLPNIKCQNLIVNGLKDFLVPQEHPQFLQKHIPNCRIIEWPEGKHNLHMRFHKDFNKLAEKFLDEGE